MGVTTYREGGVTVTLSGDLERLVRRVVDSTAGAIIQTYEGMADKVATDAEAGWYGPQGVTRRTGQSGRWETVTEVSRDAVRVGIRSLDTRRDRKGRLVAWVVHRPGPLSTISRKATQADFESGAAKHSPKGQRLPGYGKVVEPNPKASDGKQLLQELIRKPFRVQVKVVTPEIGRALSERLRRGA